MKIIINLLFLLTVASSTASAQHFFEKSFAITFPNGQANRVAYLLFPTGIPIWGTIEVEVSGGFNFQLNRGVLSKRFEIVSNGVNGFIDHAMKNSDRKMADFALKYFPNAVFKVYQVRNQRYIRYDGQKIH